MSQFQQQSSSGIGIGGVGASITNRYQPIPGAIDEMLDGYGGIRPHWQNYSKMLGELGADELTRRWAQAKRLIQENGVTHNIYGDPNGLDRPWNLDFIPLLIPARQWSSISAGLIQRARLLDMLLADIYGPAQTIRAGLLPPPLVYANPRFLRPCHGITPLAGRWLHVYGADLARSRDGQFVVLGDRTQVPSGAGYALENRAVMSHTMPNFLGQCNVQKLSPFFTSLQHSLRSLAPKNADGARVIVLTPGPYNETFFEHAYLARHLGYGLFQGKDLTVRDSKVYLKTLSGLHRVDVILRRVDDDFCDPLELFHNSYLGVPGLLQAVREGNVAIANALGSGAVQAAGFLPFLPDLCRFLLGEQLLLPSVRTWWCGEESSRKYVLANLSQLVIKPAFPSSGMISVFSAHQTADQLQQLAAKINLRPHLYVGQEVLMEYSTPALTDHGLEGRRFSVRALLTSTSKGYCVMPGALTRITDSMDSRVVSMQKGGGSKDTWIVSDSAIETATPPSTPATRAHSLSRGGDDLPSGMADDMFWLGRYVQRAQSTVRTARVMFSRIIDQSESSNQIAIGSLSSLLTVTGTNAAGATIELSLAQTLLRPNHPDGLRESLASAIRLARMLRHLLPVDAWRILQSLEREVAAFELRIDQPTASILPLLDAIAVALASFSGFANQSMTRGQAWCFLEIGQHIERAMSTPRLLRCCIPHQGNSQDITPLLDAVLDVTDNLLSYRQRYLTHFELHTVADMLLADETNPRSVAYQLASMDRHLAMLPRDRAHPYRNQDQRILLKVTGLIQLNDMLQGRDMVAQTDTQLDKMLATILEQMAMLSDVIAQMYFAHSAVPQALAGEELQL